MYDSNSSLSLPLPPLFSPSLSPSLPPPPSPSLPPSPLPPSLPPFPSSIRHLCVFVDAKAVYCTLAEILATEEKLSFASLMVRELNTILFSSAELFDLRMQLQNMDGPVSTCTCSTRICTCRIFLASGNFEGVKFGILITIHENNNPPF